MTSRPTGRSARQQVAGSYTAAGYFMARTLHKELGVPIGLINSSWGGTRVEPWTPPVGFENVPKLQNIYQSVIGRTLAPSSIKTDFSNLSIPTKHGTSRLKAHSQKRSSQTKPEFPSRIKSIYQPSRPNDALQRHDSCTCRVPDSGCHLVSG